MPEETLEALVWC